MLTQISLQESSIAVKYKAFDTEACRGGGGEVMNGWMVENNYTSLLRSPA